MSASAHARRTMLTTFQSSEWKVVFSVLRACAFTILNIFGQDLELQLTIGSPPRAILVVWSNLRPMFDIYEIKTIIDSIMPSEVQDRVMLTGRHMVRDVSCKNCDAKLGWVYEFATDETQRYKEGRVILERALVTESDGMGENIWWECEKYINGVFEVGGCEVSFSSDSLAFQSCWNQRLRISTTSNTLTCSIFESS